MALDPVDLLLTRIMANGGQWPPKAEVPILRKVQTWRAFLESDRERLAKIADWKDTSRPYQVDPLPERLVDARADYLFGEDPQFGPNQDSDATFLASIIDGNEDFVGDLHDAERTIGAEASAWWRVYVDTDVADVPLLEWHTRDEVFPLYIGKRLMAVALITPLEREGDRGPYYRHLEIHVDGAVEHVLFKGQKNRLGDVVGLDEHTETEDLLTSLAVDEATMRAAWDHGLEGMLMGVLTNRRRKRGRAVSDFDGIEDFLLGLNEATTIGSENMRLTAKRRVVVPASAVSGNPQDGNPLFGDLIDRGDGSMVPANGRSTFDAGEDVFVVDPVDSELGKAGGSPFTVLEYSFDAEPLIAWKRDLLETAATRRGLTPQWLGTTTGTTDGLALSGTALRFKLIPTTIAGRKWSRPWDEQLPNVILVRLAQVDALKTEEGGFGRTWTEPDGPMLLERASPLPTDEVEDAQVETSLVGARVRSRFQSIKRQHPDWTDTQIEDELKLIDADAPPASSALAGLGLA